MPNVSESSDGTRWGPVLGISYGHQSVDRADDPECSPELLNDINALEKVGWGAWKLNQRLQAIDIASHPIVRGPAEAHIGALVPGISQQLDANR
ncbi:hypothetical protein [Breoghania sp.]|uniref:hypothetical protein n=1 Tax=Breoghania sp. TaxID=2065378 RepID=UPI002AA91AFC|nr:hypothetical protein [Breoghania sp.]